MTAGRKIKETNKDFCTPSEYVDVVRAFFDGNIGLDPCANSFSIVKATVEYYSNGLEKSWNYNNIYVNPPYGRNFENKTTIRDWIRACCFANQTYASEVIALVPVATNTKHWKEYIFGQATGICFIYEPRIKFWLYGQAVKKGAPMACAFIYWGRDFNKFYKFFSRFGYVLKGQNA